jgi:hypothetical protein
MLWRVVTSRAREETTRILDHVDAGNPREAYCQFAVSWREALKDDRRHGGYAWREFNKDGTPKPTSPVEEGS